MIEIQNVSKTFTLHHQSATMINVLKNASFTVKPGQCVALTGNSGSGKSTLMRMIYGNYVTQTGQILIDGIDIVTAKPRDIIKLRTTTLGYVSQFLRVVPRVSTLDVVAEPLLKVGTDHFVAQSRAEELLTQLRIPEHLWPLSPLTFSGGEQQRVNIARGFAHQYPAILLDEPTASLDAKNRETVLSLIENAKKRGAAIIGIFHDEAARDRVCDEQIDVSKFTPEVAA